MNEKIPPKPSRDDMRCLVCGDEILPRKKVSCDENSCKFSVHLECIKVLAQLNEEHFVESEFVCNHVNYYLRPSEIAEVLLGIDNITKLVKKAVLKRGEIDHRSYCSKRKRYENPDIFCNKCGQIVGINEIDHELRYCSAVNLGAPIPTRDFEYTASKYKRIRRCALYDYPP